MAHEMQGGHIIIPQDKVPAAAYQAIYHKLTSKVEKLRQTFDDVYEICTQDIVQLDSMLRQTVKQFQVQSQNSVCDISFQGNTKIESSSIERFSIINFSINKPTKIIQYTFDFYSILPVEIKDVEDIVQRFKVNVKIDQDFIEDEENIPFFMAGITSGKNISLTIEYSDYVVSRNLQTCVQDWVACLPTQKIPKYITFIEGRFDAIYGNMPYLFPVSFLFGQSVFKNIDYHYEYNGLLRSISYAILMFILGKILSTQIVRRIQSIKPLTFIKITSADMTRFEKIRNKKRKEITLFIFFSITIPVAIAINIFSSYIWQVIATH